MIFPPMPQRSVLTWTSLLELGNAVSITAGVLAPSSVFKQWNCLAPDATFILSSLVLTQSGRECSLIPDDTVAPPSFGYVHAVSRPQ
jgi:hypothetical protein